MEEMEIVAAGLITVEYNKQVTHNFDDIPQEAEEDFGTGKFAKHQKTLWDLIEHSDSSKAAQVQHENL